MKTLKLMGIVLVVSLFFSGCPTGGNKSGKLRNIDIVGARALMIAPAGSMSRTARAANTENVFLKQLDDGSWVQVRMSDEEGAEIQMEPPFYIIDATENWMIIGFGDKYNYLDAEYYLVSKINGDVYDLTPAFAKFGHPTTFGSGNIYEPSYFEDNNSSIYYNAGGKIIKISVSSTDASAERITSDAIEVFIFSVDYKGNITYHQYTDAGGNSYRLRTVDGTILPLNDIVIDDKKHDGFFSTKLDGYFYGSFKPEDSDVPNLYKVEIGGNTLESITLTPVFSDDVLIDLYFNRGNNISIGLLAGPYCFSDKLVELRQNDTGHHIFSFYKNGDVKHIEGSGSLPSNPNSITAGKKDIFVWDGNQIVSIDTETGNVKTIFTNTEYDVIEGNTSAAKWFVLIK